MSWPKGFEPDPSSPYTVNEQIGVFLENRTDDAARRPPAPTGWLEMTEDGQLVSPQTNPSSLLYEPPYAVPSEDYAAWRDQ